MFFILANLLSWGEPAVDETIIVEAHKDLEIYVAPIKVSNTSENIKISFHKEVIMGYASSHYHNAKIKNERGIYEPLLMNNSKPMFYNEDTISYVWDNCNYLVDPKKCAYQNNHYLLETNITLDETQLVLTLYLIDSDLQIIARSTVTDTKIVNYIKQQEQTVETNQPNISVQNNCPGGICPTVTNQPLENQKVTIKKEEIPLKWEISPSLLNKHFHQASLLMWSSTKFDI